MNQKTDEAILFCIYWKEINPSSRKHNQEKIQKIPIQFAPLLFVLESISPLDMGSKGLSLAFAFCASATFGLPGIALASETAHVKIYDHGNERIVDIKAIENGKYHDVKILIDKNCSNAHGDACLHKVNAFVDGAQLPIKAVATEPNGLISIKAITRDGNMLDIKGITSDGEIVDIKARPGTNSLSHGVKAIFEDGSVAHVKVFDKDGGFYHIKAKSASPYSSGRNAHGVTYWGDVRAIEY